MIIAERTLFVGHGANRRALPISIEAPVETVQEAEWSCWFTIQWPDGDTTRARGANVDAVGALVGALQAIGAYLYASAYHRERTLVNPDCGEGYGFSSPRADVRSSSDTTSNGCRQQTSEAWGARGDNPIHRSLEMTNDHRRTHLVCF